MQRNQPQRGEQQQEYSGNSYRHQRQQQKQQFPGDSLDAGNIDFVPPYMDLPASQKTREGDLTGGAACTGNELTRSQSDALTILYGAQDPSNWTRAFSSSMSMVASTIPAQAAGLYAQSNEFNYGIPSELFSQLNSMSTAAAERSMTVTVNTMAEIKNPRGLVYQQPSVDPKAQQQYPESVLPTADWTPYNAEMDWAPLLGDTIAAEKHPTRTPTASSSTSATQPYPRAESTDASAVNRTPPSFFPSHPSIQRQGRRGSNGKEEDFPWQDLYYIQRMQQLEQQQQIHEQNEHIRMLQQQVDSMRLMQLEQQQNQQAEQTRIKRFEQEQRGSMINKYLEGMQEQLERRQMHQHHPAEAQIDQRSYMIPQTPALPIQIQTYENPRQASGSSIIDIQSPLSDSHHSWVPMSRGSSTHSTIAADTADNPPADLTRTAAFNRSPLISSMPYSAAQLFPAERMTGATMDAGGAKMSAIDPAIGRILMSMGYTEASQQAAYMEEFSRQQHVARAMKDALAGGVAGMTKAGVPSSPLLRDSGTANDQSGAETQTSPTSVQSTFPPTIRRQMESAWWDVQPRLGGTPPKVSATTIAPTKLRTSALSHPARQQTTESSVTPSTSESRTYTSPSATFSMSPEPEFQRVMDGVFLMPARRRAKVPSVVTPTEIAQTTPDAYSTSLSDSSSPVHGSGTEAEQNAGLSTTSSSSVLSAVATPAMIFSSVQLQKQQHQAWLAQMGLQEFASKTDPGATRTGAPATPSAISTPSSPHSSSRDVSKAFLMSRHVNAVMNHFTNSTLGFQRLINELDDMVMTLTADGTVLYAGPATSIVTEVGLPPDSIIGHRVDEFLHADDWLNLQECISVALGGANVSGSGEASQFGLFLRWRRGHRENLDPGVGVGDPDEDGRKLPTPSPYVLLEALGHVSAFPSLVTEANHAADTPMSDSQAESSQFDGGGMALTPLRRGPILVLTCRHCHPTIAGSTAPPKTAASAIDSVMDLRLEQLRLSKKLSQVLVSQGVDPSSHHLLAGFESGEGDEAEGLEVVQSDDFLTWMEGEERVANEKRASHGQGQRQEETARRQMTPQETNQDARVDANNLAPWNERSTALNSARTMATTAAPAQIGRQPYPLLLPPPSQQTHVEESGDDEMTVLPHPVVVPPKRGRGRPPKRAGVGTTASRRSAPRDGYSGTGGELGEAGGGGHDGGAGDDSHKRKKKRQIPQEELFCRQCGTTTSPEWRKGPDGPKTLCNACGLAFSKRQRRQSAGDTRSAVTSTTSSSTNTSNIAQPIPYFPPPNVSTYPGDSVQAQPVASPQSASVYYNAFGFADWPMHIPPRSGGEIQRGPRRLDYSSQQQRFGGECREEDEGTFEMLDDGQGFGEMEWPDKKEKMTD
ncbi:hypothetical protein BJ742DRAFT_494270 [Cladochytrium replicatum]|nr:hypothetical protein BJ742DRAFT_494270 [Cladochytrium replicatum]